MARVLLKNGVDIANQQAAELAGAHADWGNNGEFAALQDLLSQACATERAVLETFTAENGKEIAVALAQGQVKVTVGEVAHDRIHLTLANGADRSYTLDELEISERLNRLKRSGGSGAGVTLLKAVWAYRAHAMERARTLLATLPDPAGATLARVVDEKP